MNNAQKASQPGSRQALVRLLPKNPDLMQVYQLATGAEDSERIIVGAILHDSQVYHQVATDLQPGDFGRLNYAMIYRAMQEIATRGEDIDAVVVADELAKPDYKAVHNSVTLESLLSMLREPPRLSLLETHVKRIRDAALRVRVCEAAGKCGALAFDKSLSADELVSQTDALMDAATERSYQRASDMMSISAAFYDQVESAANTGKAMVIPTGFGTLDEIIGGLGNGELTILAGDEGKGKSTVMLSLVLNQLRAGRRVVLFSLEMSQAEVCRKLVTMLTGIPAAAFRNADLTPTQMALFVDAIAVVEALPLDIIDEYPQLTPGQFERRTRQLLSRQDMALLVIDGLWLMTGDEPTRERHIEVSRITKALLALAKRIDKPVLALHQYTGDQKNRADKTPTLYDMAESAAVRRDAHLILGLHRVSFANEKYDVSQCYTLKDRASGRAGEMATLYFDGEHQMYYAAPKTVRIVEDGSNG